MDDEVAELLTQGIPLHEFGINGHGLDLSSAMAAVSKCAEKGLPILGGDVLLNDEGKIRHQYENWTTNRRDYESEDKFIAASHEKSIEFLESYKTDSNNTLFLIVVGDQE